MAVYVVGDIQGCYKALKKLLKSVGFNYDADRLWLVGDVVNRGPDSLKTLRFVKDLGEQAVTVLGNHDLHLLATYYGDHKPRSSDTFQPVLKAKDCDDLMEWLRYRPLLHHDVDLNFTMVHAGIYPGWSISKACALAQEVETVLQAERKQYRKFLIEMYGNDPATWSEDLAGMERLRFITNVFTRMRFITADKGLDLKAKGSPDNACNSAVKPWFELKQSAIKHNRVVFGHWSTLTTGQYGRCYALDGGCVWGSRLTTLRIDKKTPRWYSLPCND